LENVTSACYFFKNNRTAVTIDFSWANNTLFLVKNSSQLYSFFPIADIRQIIFAHDNELNLCTLSAAWPEKPTQYYYWETYHDLNKFESSAILKSKVSYLKDLNVTVRGLKGNIVNIECTYSDG